MNLLASSKTARDLARLLAAWLAVIVFVQAMAAAGGMVQGPRHRHLGSGSAAALPPGAVAAVFAHAGGEHHHAGWQRHVHLTADPANPTLSDDAQELAAAAGAVLAAMVAVGPSQPAVLDAQPAHVMRASQAWSLITGSTAPLERPPRG